MRCLKCGATESQNKEGRTKAGSQRYGCKECGRSYTPSPKDNGYSDAVRGQALQLIADGVNFRRAARLVGVNHQTVINWFRASVAKLAAAPQPSQADVIEMDEVFTFVGRKKSKSSSSPS